MFRGGGTFSFFDLAFVLCSVGRFKDGEIGLLLCFVVVVDGAAFNESKIFISGRFSFSSRNRALALLPNCFIFAEESVIG